ncbi:hypothetical protein [Staphylococcus nepalensis]|uniref:hypothetical protein n=1 Tax=Staphylococcus nepalensis TaxID=214473 RepID=UPI003EE80D54
MNEPTEIKYPYDENGEPYYAATHIDAIKNLEELIESYLKPLNEKIEKQQEEIKLLKNEILDNKKGDEKNGKL